MNKMFRYLAACLCAALLLAACRNDVQEDTASSLRQESRYSPIDPSYAVFWDRQTTETARLLRELVAEYNAQRPEGLLPVKLEHVGGYSDIFRKVSASIRAGELPGMAVGYQSMTAEYILADAVTNLDPFLGDPESGLSQEDLDDFFPAVLETNIYEGHDSRMYSFPFCKSVLMMYFNKRVMARAGLDHPPRTWDEFMDQCRQVMERTGKYACALDVDCSTVNGWIFSMGGDVISGRKTQYDSPEALRVFEIIQTLADEKLAYQITPGTYDDEVALANDEVAFTFRSSSARTALTVLMEGDLDRWGIAPIPQADHENPGTVLYGPNICIFNTTEDQQRAAWAFIKYFTSPETTVKWALGTGYLPTRKSAARDPAMRKFWDEWEYNRAAFDCLHYARPEPTVLGWQEVRGLVEKAETAILTGLKTAPEAARELTRQADALLARPAQ